MNKFSSSLKKGFTLIEILIVIALLGVLAVALLATIDPLEQIRKGNDSKTQNISSELNGAFDRYYATRQEYPWLAGGTTTALSVGDTNIAAAVSAGELKANFAASAGATTLGAIFLTTGTASKSLCFVPTSKAMQYDKNAIFNQNGTAWSGVGTCKGAATPGAANCYWCINT